MAVHMNAKSCRSFLKGRRPALVVLLVLGLALSFATLVRAGDRGDDKGHGGDHRDNRDDEGHHDSRDSIERCGSEDVESSRFDKDRTFGGRCNGHRPDDDGYWKSTYTSITVNGKTIANGTKVTYNDDKYGSLGDFDIRRRQCGAPNYIGCCDTCSNAKGSVGVYDLPLDGACRSTVASDTAVYCAGSSLTQADCCTAASSASAVYWLHYVPAGSSSKGICYVYPKYYVGAPTCVTAAFCGRLFGNMSTVGKTCPYGKHDPHFRGAHGTLFEFNGLPDKSFCLLTDRHVHLNMKMRGYLDSRTVGASILKGGRAVRTWIRELGLLWDDEETGETHSLRLVARDGKSMARDGGFLAAAEVDGHAVALPKLGEKLEGPAGLLLAFKEAQKEGGFYDMDVYQLQLGKVLSLKVSLRAAHPLLQTRADAQVHFNVQLNHVVTTEEVHGVLGQTFRSGRERRGLDYAALNSLLKRTIAADSEAGKGFLDGSVGDYETSSVLAADCAYTAFGGKQLPAAV